MTTRKPSTALTTPPEEWTMADRWEVARLIDAAAMTPERKERLGRDLSAGPQFMLKYAHSGEVACLVDAAATVTALDRQPQRRKLRTALLYHDGAVPRDVLLRELHEDTRRHMVAPQGRALRALLDEAAAVGWPDSYWVNLAHDRDELIAWAPRRFAWVLRPQGTQLCRPNMQGVELVAACERVHRGEPTRFYWWGGERLTRATPESVHERLLLERDAEEQRASDVCPACATAHAANRRQWEDRGGRHVSWVWSLRYLPGDTYDDDVRPIDDSKYGDIARCACACHAHGRGMERSHLGEIDAHDADWRLRPLD